MNIAAVLKEKLRLIKYFFITLFRYISNKPLDSRNQLPLLLAILGLNGQGIEIGVAFGVYSEIILNYSRLSIVYSVDSWKEYGRDVYFDNFNVSQEEQEKSYQSVIEKLKRYGGRSKVLRMDSSEASKLFHTEELDFVYIDANHAYAECRKDLEAWWPKLKKGGILSGHDYMDELNWNCEVKKAVDEFVNKHKQKLLITKEKEFPTWYLIKKI